jgi:hypothetical protein
MPAILPAGNTLTFLKFLHFTSRRDFCGFLPRIFPGTLCAFVTNGHASGVETPPFLRVVRRKEHSVRERVIADLSMMGFSVTGQHMKCRLSVVQPQSGPNGWQSNRQDTAVIMNMGDEAFLHECHHRLTISLRRGVTWWRHGRGKGRIPDPEGPTPQQQNQEDEQESSHGITKR